MEEKIKQLFESETDNQWQSVILKTLYAAIITGREKQLAEYVLLFSKGEMERIELIEKVELGS